MSNSLEFFFNGFPKETKMVPITVRKPRKATAGTSKPRRSEASRKRLSREEEEEQVRRSCLIIEKNGTAVGRPVNGWHDPFEGRVGIAFAADGLPV